jgi:hypothetical protein
MHIGQSNTESSAISHTSYAMTLGIGDELIYCFNRPYLQRHLWHRHNFSNDQPQSDSLETLRLLIGKSLPLKRLKRSVRYQFSAFNVRYIFRSLFFFLAVASSRERRIATFCIPRSHDEPTISRDGTPGVAALEAQDQGRSRFVGGPPRVALSPGTRAPSGGAPGSRSRKQETATTGAPTRLTTCACTMTHPAPASQPRTCSPRRRDHHRRVLGAVPSSRGTCPCAAAAGGGRTGWEHAAPPHDSLNMSKAVRTQTSVCTAF